MEQQWRWEVTDEWRTNFKVATGGLMRCCLLTLDQFMATTPEPPKEGETLQCIYHEGYGMIYRKDVWRWNTPEDGSNVKLGPHPSGYGQ
jgi:hypothetical protein